MSVVALRRKAARKGERSLVAAHGATIRGVAYAKTRVGGLAAQGRRFAREVDGRIARFTPWTAFAVCALLLLAA